MVIVHQVQNYMLSYLPFLVFQLIKELQLLDQLTKKVKFNQSVELMKRLKDSLRFVK